MHIKKRPRNSDICKDSKVDAWEDIVEKDELIDKYVDKQVVKRVEEKTYLESIVQSNCKNDKNMQDKINKAVGSVKRIICAINERPYGRHTFKAALLIKQGIMLSSMLTS